MEKRFIAFVAASVMIMAGFMLLQIWLGGKAQPNKPIPLANKKAEDKKAEDKKGDKEQGEKPDGEKPPKPVAEPGTKEPGGKEPDGEKPAVVEKPERPARKEPRPQWVSIGSVDPSSPFRMNVTFNNRGGGLERIELSSPEYIDLEDRAGYLGHLALTAAEKGKGCLVNVVGAGTPAAQATAKESGVAAGLQVGDVIQSFDGKDIATPDELDSLLSESKPGQKVELLVVRESNGKRTKLSFTADLIYRPMQVVRPEHGTAADAHVEHPLSLLTTLYSIGTAAEDGTTEGTVKVKRGEREIEGLPSLEKGLWETKILEGDSPGVEFHFQLDEDDLKAVGQTGQIEVIKRYRLAQTPEAELRNRSYKSYHLEYELEIFNHGQKPQQIAYQQSGPNGLPLEGWWYQNKIHPGWWKGAGVRDVIWKTGLSHHLMGCPQIYDDAIAKTRKESVLFSSSEPPPARRVRYAGVDAQYFTADLMPQDEDEAGVIFDRGEARPATPTIKADKKAGRKITNVTFDLVSQPNRIAPGESFKQSFVLFAGPKEGDLLSQYKLDSAIEYGWFWWVAKPLIRVLHFFHDYLVHNWGLSIIMLTVLVRGCLHPIGRRMAKNMQAMQDLAPEIKAIKEKYKDDMAKQGKAQQELFKKNHINPYAGCLPLFLQMPIFIGLYRALSVDIALRQAPLIPGLHWCSNLAGPDMLWFWKPYLLDMLAGESGWLGPYLNVLPLVTAGLFLWQQKKFTPPPTDEQQEMQQKMMNFMTIFMSVMFFKVPAGLCLYFITSSLWGLAERTWMMPKRKTGGSDAVVKTAPKKTPDKPGSNGSEQKEEARKKLRKR